MSVFKVVIGQTERPEWSEVEGRFQSKRRPLWGWEAPSGSVKV
jgi:hypothetical protein